MSRKLVAEKAFYPDRGFTFFNFCQRCGQEIAHAEAEAARIGEESVGGGAAWRVNSLGIHGTLILTAMPT